MFALADATLMRPLPYPDADRLVMVWERAPTFPRVPMSPVTLRDLDEQTRTFERLGGINMGIGGGPLLEAPDGTLQSVDRQFVTARFFDALGVQPIAGRTFRPAEAEGAGAAVVVMSEGLWRTRFGADPSLIGREIRLNGQPFTVIGVVPDDVQLQRPARIWSLLPEVPDALRAVAASRGARSLQVVGRLKPGVTLEAARADLAAFGERLARDYPATHKGFSINVEPLRAGVMGPDLQLTSLFLFGVVGFVLLLCCANVANLLLARGSVRSRELAVRSALGAGKSRIIAQLLTESLVLATLGGLVGLALGVDDSEAGNRGDPRRAPASGREARLRWPRPGVLRRSQRGCRIAVRCGAGVASHEKFAGAGDRVRQQIGHAKGRAVSESGGCR